MTQKLEKSGWFTHSIKRVRSITVKGVLNVIVYLLALLLLSLIAMSLIFFALLAFASTPF